MDLEEHPTVVEIHWKGGLKMESSVRQFTPILMDDRKIGEDSAPTPVEMFLSSIASCMSMSFLYCCHLSGIQLGEGDLSIKVSGQLGRVDNRLRVTGIDVDFMVKSSEDDIKVQKCFKKFQPFCILSESIKPAIPINCNLKIRD